MNGIRRMMMMVAAPVTPPSEATLIFKLNPSTGITLDGNSKVSSIVLEGGYTASQSDSAKRYAVTTINGFPTLEFNGTAWLRIPSIELGYTTTFAVVKALSGGGYFSEHNNNAYTNPGCYFYLYGTNLLECYYHRSYNRGISTPNSGLLGTGARAVVCHRFGASELYGTTNELYVNSPTPVVTGPGEPEEKITYPYTIGAGGDNSEPMVGGYLARMEVHTAMTDAAVAAKMTELMTTFSTL